MKILRYFLWGLAALAIAGCSNDNNDDDAQLRLLHGSPDAPAVDVRVNDDSVIQDLAYTEGTGYISVPTGASTVTISAAGTDQTVVTGEQVFNKDVAYTVIATGRLADLQPLVLEEDRSDPAEGNLKIRVVHGAPDVGAVDVYVTPPAQGLADVAPVLANLAFRDASPSLEIPAGEYQIRITPAGEKGAVYDSGPVALSSGSLLTTVALTAISGSSPVILTVLTDDANNPVLQLPDVHAAVRTVHASPDAPLVDLIVNGEVAAQNLGFTDATAYLPVPAPNPSIALNVAGTSTQVLTAQPALEKGGDYTVVAVGFAASLEPLLLTDDRTLPATGQARIRFVHASPDAPAVDILVDGTPVATNVSFRDASAYLTPAAGEHSVAVNLTGTATTVLGPLSITLGNQGVYTVMVTGQAISLLPLVLTDRAPVAP